MCKKDTDGGSYCCCKCCTPTVSSIVVAIVGAAILVASFVIAAVVLTMLQDGIVKTARYNSPNTDAKAYNDWLSNVPSERSTNDASLKYYQYYFFNITNLNEVVMNSLTGAITSSVVPIVDEIGPYTYRYYVNRYDATFATIADPEERLTYKEYYRYVFEPSLSKYGSVQLNDQTDKFITTSALYSSVFGNPFNASGLVGAAEFLFRAGTATQIGFAYLDWLNKVGATSYDGALFNPADFVGRVQGCVNATTDAAVCLQGGYTMHLLYANQISTSMLAKGYTYSSAAWLKYGNAAFGASLNRWASAPPLEYWAFAQAAGLTPLGAEGQAQALFSPTFTQTGVSSCPALTFGVTGTAACWLNLPLAAIAAALSPIGITTPMAAGLQAYVGYLTFNYWDWLFTSNGHMGPELAPLFKTYAPGCAMNTSTVALLSVSTNYAGANEGTGYGACTAFNNGNLYVRATPRQLLFDQYNTIGSFLYFNSTTKVLNRRNNISFATNYTDLAQSQQDGNFYTVGTGIPHINDIDNLYAWKKVSALPADLRGPWCHKNIDADYAPGGLYYIQHFQMVPGWSYRQANQAQMTKYTPNYPPGRVSDDNRYMFENSVISDKSFALDLFVGDISRHAKMVFYRDASVKGIDIQRYTIDDSEFNAGLLFFGQYFKGLANYSCPAAGGVNTFSCYPRYGVLEKTALNAASYFNPATRAGSVFLTYGIDLATINSPTNAQFLQNSQMGDLFGSAEELIAMIDLEPTSGAALGGTLKQQVNILVTPYQGANLAVYLNSSYPHNPNPKFANVFRSASPNSHQYRATLMPVYWLNKIGFLSDKQADSFKTAVYGAKLASRVVLIVGSIVGGLMMFVALGFIIVKRRGGYNTQTSKSDLAL